MLFQTAARVDSLQSGQALTGVDSPSRKQSFERSSPMAQRRSKALNSWIVGDSETSRVRTLTIMSASRGFGVRTGVRRGGAAFSHEGWP